MTKHDLEKEKSEGGDDTELKVNDRRLFTAEGELREGTEGDSEPEEEAAGGESDDSDREPPARPAEPDANAPGEEAGF